MMRRGGETADEELARFKESRRFGKAVEDDPRRAARHRLRARRQGDVPDLGSGRPPVRQGRDLRRDLGLPARLRRPLSVDAPEGDRRLALRQRLGGDEGEPADRGVQGAPRAVADDGLREGRRRRTSCCATTSTSARSRSSSAPPRRARARPPRVPARSERRWAPDGRRHACRLVRDRAASGAVRGRGLPRSPRSRSATAPPQYAVHRSRDDRYKITQMAWFESKPAWYRYWEGPEMIEFRRRHIGQVPDPDHVHLVRRARRRRARPRGRPRAGAAPEPEPAAVRGRLTQVVKLTQPSAGCTSYPWLPVTRAHKIVNLIGVPLPLVGLVAAIVLLWNQAIGPLELGLLIGLYVLTALGRDARLPPDVHAPRVRVQPRVPRDRRRARLDGGTRAR